MLKIYNELLKKIGKDKVYLNELMSKHTTFKIGGPADMYVKIDNLEDLKWTLKTVKENNIPLTIIGNGSNILVKDGGIRGIILKINFKEIEVSKNSITAGAGVLLTKLSNTALEHDLMGLEFAVRNTTEVFGGAIRMNAGAYGKEIKDILISTTYIDENSEIHTITNKENLFNYRTSRFAQNKKEIVLSATFNLKKSNKEEIKQKMKSNTEIRKTKQPINLPSAGSSFKRGNNFITAELIDKCGLKGYNVGDAFVSELHAGFIVNKGNASAKDVLKLSEIIKQKVYEKFKVKIELEFEILGED